MVLLRSSEWFPLEKKHVAAGISVLLIAAIILYLFSRSTTNQLVPTYDIVLPQRTSVEDLGGWQRVSPDGSDPIFAYTDSIKSIGISVSQQPLPASFADNTAAEIKRIAEGYSATTVIEAGGTQAYIGRSARGPQSVIFAKGNTLVLIKSQQSISQADWIAYINNLVDPTTEQTPTF